MRIGILETGKVSETLIDRHAPYEIMFRSLLRQVDPQAQTSVWDVVGKGEIPGAPDAMDGWIVTGSKYGVYDPMPWIDPLKGFLRRTYEARVPVVGVCFGHQILAEALGGKVEKSGKGWGCGVHSYAVTSAAPWMTDGEHPVRVHAMHQDQVVTLPPDARVVASSEFCEYAGLAYGDMAFSMQPHPEFDAVYEADVINLRRGVAIPDDVADAGLATLEGGVDNDRVAQWIVGFFRQAMAAKKAA